MTRRAKQSAIVVVAVGVLLQFLPLAHPRTNPPESNALGWPSEEARALFMRACGDCHSNATRWPWYSVVAPVSWIVTGHVRHGRGSLNVSAWDPDRFTKSGHRVVTTLQDRSMPPTSYVWMHPTARLSPDETRVLIAGLRQISEFNELR